MRELSSLEIDAVSGGVSATPAGACGTGIGGVLAAGLMFSEFGPLEWAGFGFALTSFYFGCGGQMP